MTKWLWLMIAGVLAACGDGGGGGAVAFEDSAREADAALCQYFMRCGLAKTTDDCAKVTGGPALIRATLTADVASGKVTFDGDRARTCYDALADQACDITRLATAPEACATYFAGTVHEGASCTIDEECISQHCAVPSCDQACCPGTCTGDAVPTLAATGESCEIGGCADGNYCDGIERVCKARKGANASCEVAAECSPGLYCLSTHACGALPGDGQPCSDDGCQLVNQTCSPATHTCVTAGVVGDPCTSATDCATLYECDSTHHCSAGLALGAACQLGGDRCAGDAICEVPDGELAGTCATRHAAGGACESNADCLYSCDLTTSTCRADMVCN